MMDTTTEECEEEQVFLQPERFDVHCMSYNIMTPTAEPIRYSGQMERIAQIRQAIETWETNSGISLDVITVQESIIESQHHVVRSIMRSMGFVHDTNMSFNYSKLVTGGVCIFSRRPILYDHSAVFDTAHTGCLGADCLSAKGFVHAVVEIKPGVAVNIISTHLQAAEGPAADQIRLKQCQIIGDYVREQILSTNMNRFPVILTGDLNTDQFTQTTQLDRMMQQLCMTRLQVDGISLDPQTNQLVGNDTPEEYVSVSYPVGCYDQYMQSLRCVCCPSVTVDFVCIGSTLPSGNWRAVPDRSSVKVVQLKASEPYATNMNLRKSIMTTDISDHYPVHALIVLQKGSSPGDVRNTLHLRKTRRRRALPQLPTEDPSPMFGYMYGIVSFITFALGIGVVICAVHRLRMITRSLYETSV